jgi:hypothetical protein
VNIEFLDNFIKEEPVINFIENYRNLNTGYRFCKGNIFGVNVSQKKINSVKFYFATSRYLEKNEILNFLPSSNELEAAYDYVNLSNNTICTRGVTFAIKKRGNVYTTQFHFKVDPLKKELFLRNYGKINLIKNIFEGADSYFFDGTEHYGLAVEYLNNIPVFKKYIYFYNTTAKNYFCAERSKAVEYTVSDFGEKIIILENRKTKINNLPKLNKSLFYKNTGMYLDEKTVTGYIYPKNIIELEKENNVDTLQIYRDSIL